MASELVDRASRGDREAFSSLMASVFDRCYALAYRILRDPDRADDATQQALIGAWRDLPALRDHDRFEPWLYRLVVHACYVESRSRRRWLARVRPLEPEAPVAIDVAPGIAARDELEAAF